MKSKTENSTNNEDKNNVIATAVSDIYFDGDDACYNLTS